MKRVRFKSLYGITLEERDALFVKQGSVCGICKTPEPTTSRGWHTDHDHATGVVRGVLCHHCNTLLGVARDNPQTLSNAIEYLGKFNGKEGTLA